MSPNNSQTNDSSNISSSNNQDIIKTNTEEGYFTQAKNWIKANPIKAAGIGVGLLTAGLLIYNHVKESAEDKKQNATRKSKRNNNSQINRSTKKKGDGLSGFSSSGKHSKKWNSKYGKRAKRKINRRNRKGKSSANDSNQRVNEIALF
jgi:hypothetical protein